MSLGRGRGGGKQLENIAICTDTYSGFFLISKKVIKAYLLIIVFALTPEIYI